MLEAGDFATLEKGDVVETYPLFPGLGPELVLLRVASVTKMKIEFVATYFGVTLGRWAATLKGEKVEWSFK